MTKQDYLDYISYVQGYESKYPNDEDMFTRQYREAQEGPAPNVMSYGQWLASDGDPKVGSQYPYILPASQGDTIRAIKRGYLEVSDIETAGEDSGQMVDARNFWGSMKPGDKVPIDKSGWYKVPDDVDPSYLRVPPGSYVNAITGRYVPPGGEKPTSPLSGKEIDYDTSTKWYDYAGQINKMATGPLQGEPGGSNRGKVGELEAANWFIGKVAAMGAAAGGSGGEWSTGAVEPGDFELYSSTGPPATGGEIDWGNVGKGVVKQGAKAVVSYGVNKLSSGLDSDSTGISGGQGGSVPESRPIGFNVEDTPLSMEFLDNEKIIDDLLKKAGETGDYTTAVEAVNSFQTIAANRTILEQEIQKYKDDPDFKTIEPEIRVATEEAIQKGMTPKQATAYAFETAKRERGFREFIKEYQMRKRLELAGLTGEEEAGVLNSFDEAGYGLRNSGAPKGQGWLGPLPMTEGSGRTATELSITVDGKDIPLIVPTLKQEEIDSLLAGAKPTRAMVNKAIEFARQRKKQGFSVYAD